MLHVGTRKDHPPLARLIIASISQRCWPPRYIPLGSFCIRELHLPSSNTALRKAHTLTQQGLADALGMHLSQIKRYENGTSQPSLEALKKIALLFNITTDELVFDATERSPSENLRLHFEAVSQFDPQSQQTVLNVIDGLMLKHQAKTWGQRRALAPATANAPAARSDAAQRTQRTPTRKRKTAR